eukprot:TRINITY_DN24481_c0_g1_i1.p1 TRINITY_DN24481_c0_g1~~TRINITY_DN24481_c0_g1_i1.p1  ORF type:complete len:316 (+),score=115.27 TRINITY_DN24481_c0_g1_i1:44-991(+)
MAAAEPLKKSIQQLLKKYVDQHTVMSQTKKQINALQSKNERLEAEMERLKAEKAKEEDMKESLEKLAKELKKKKDETFEEVRQREAAEAEARSQLTKKFQNTIADITSKMESDAEEQLAAVNENKRLRHRLAALGQQVDLRAQQFEQLIKTREVELKLSEAKTEHLREIAKGDRFRIELQEKQHEEEKKNEAELKQQLNTLTSKFDELQTTITKSNKLFKEYKGEMDKMTKKIRLLENEKSEIAKRYTTKKKPHDTVSDEVNAQIKKLDQLKKAHQAMTGVTEVLKKESADFERWAAACPEEYKRLSEEFAAAEK